MFFYKKVEKLEKEIKEMKENYESETFENCYIRKLVGRQKGELEVISKYYKGNIAEGNWSLLENDSDIEELDKEKRDKEKVVDSLDVALGLDKYEKECDEYTREKDAEYQYVFIPSYYAVKTLILYYLNNRKQAKKVYGLTNAVVRRDCKKSEKFYGGLPFILKYMKEIYIKRKVKDDSIKLDFADVMQKIMNLRLNNINDEFINDIIDCIRKSHCGSFILDKRIKDIKDEKDDLLLYATIDDYKILMHRDVEKDFMHLQKVHEEKAKEKIKKTPNHPNNDYPRDSEKLKGDLKGWFSQ